MAKRNQPKKPEVKLIEGKYSHKFLVRLHPVEGEFLDHAMKKHGIKTFTGMVTKMIVSYEVHQKTIEQLNNQLTNCRAALREAKQDLAEISWAIKKAVNYVDAPDENEDWD